MLTTNRCLGALSVFFCCLMIFTLGLHGKEITGFDSRFYLFAIEMRARGLSWFPTTYQKPYPDYLGTSTAFIYFFAWLFGGLSKFVAILPTAISAALTLLVTYLIGACRHERWGLYAVFFALMTIIFFQSARSISLDMQLTLITTVCFYLLYSADMRNQPIKLIWVFLLLCLGFALRGPIGLIIPTGVICIYYLLGKNFKKLFLLSACALGLLMVCCAVLLFLAYQTGGMTFLCNVLHMEAIGRMNNLYLPRYFYFTTSLSNYSLSLPLMWLVISGVIYYRLTTHYQSHDTALLIKLLGWVMIIMIGMSIPGDKKMRYILPIVPAIALIAAYIFFAPPRQRYFSYLRKIVSSILFCFPGLFFLLLSGYLYRMHLVFHLSMIFFLLGFVLFSMQIINFYGYRKQWREREGVVLAIATLSFVLTYIYLIEPIENHRDQSLAFVRQIELLRAQHQAALAFYNENPDGLPIKYLINMRKLVYPFFIKQSQDLMNVQQPVFFVTSETYFNALPSAIMSKLTVITKSELGHVPVVVFTSKVMKSDGK